MLVVELIQQLLHEHLVPEKVCFYHNIELNHLTQLEPYAWMLLYVYAIIQISYVDPLFASKYVLHHYLYNKMELPIHLRET